MAANDSQADPSAKPRRHWIYGVPLAILLALGIASWYLNASLSDRPTSLPDRLADSDAPPPPRPDRPETLPEWPQGTLSGDAAKKLLLASALVSTAKLSRIETYTATLRSKSDSPAISAPENTLSMKVRNRPFAIYLKFLAPKAGKEVLYAEGHHENKVVAHNGDWTRKLIPRLKVAPDSSLAMADNRHPVTEAGLVHLANKLLGFRKKDIGDQDASTVIDRIVDPDGKPWLRSIHTHAVADGSRPFARVEVHYDPVTQFPLRIFNYDWPAPGHTGELELAERYAYDDLKLNAPLTPADFDLTNPEYAFMRY